MTKLTDFKLLSFDVYGTLIDWERGVLTALQPTLDANNCTKYSRKELLKVYAEFEASQQAKTPDMPYSKLVETILSPVAAKLGLKEPTAAESQAFGQSVAKWPAFPDTVDALRRLSKHYKLVVLSNVDLDSFAGTLSGPLQNSHFDLIITAQDVGSYKPDLRNFEHMLSKVQEKFAIDKKQVLQTAQSQFHDHQPAKKMDIRSAWIARPGSIMGNRDNAIFDWKFDTLGDMADAVEKEAK